jgi:hypothetical protein
VNRKLICMAATVIALPMCSFAQTTQETPDQRIKDLQRRIDELERKSQPFATPPFRLDVNPPTTNRSWTPFYVYPRNLVPQVVPPPVGSGPDLIPMPQAPLPPEDRSKWIERRFNSETFYIVPLTCNQSGTPAIMRP